MHEMQTVVTDDCGVCPYVYWSVTQLNVAVHAVCVWSFGVTYVKLLWPLIITRCECCVYSNEKGPVYRVVGFEVVPHRSDLFPHNMCLIKMETIKCFVTLSVITGY